MPIPRQQSAPEDGADRVRPSQPSSGSLLTPAEAASVLGVDANTLARWSRAGRLSAVRTPGGHRRYLASEVARLRRESEERTDRSRSA